MEYFTTKELNDVVKPESFSEKFLSKVQNVFSSLDYLTNSFSECVCGDTSKAPMSPKHYHSFESEAIQSPPAKINEVVESRSNIPTMLFSYEELENHVRDS